jgi:hypothetical protein
MPILDIKTQRVTKRMIEYMEILFNDVELATSIRARNNWLSAELKRTIRYLDHLTISEGHQVIDRLKQIKESRK